MSFVTYFIWRFSKSFVGYWVIAYNFSRFFTHILAVNLMLRTIFWPWKRDLTLKSSQSFDIVEWFRRHMFNFFSRIIGFLIKLFTTIFWLFFEIIWWIVTIVFFPVWILSPFVVLGLLYYVATTFPGVNALNFSSDWLPFIISLIGALFLVVFEFKVFEAHRLIKLLEPDIKNPALNDPWFISISSHLLVDPETLKAAWGQEPLKQIIKKAHLTRSEFDKIADWEIARQIESVRIKCFWLKDNLTNKRPITEDWVFGWTYTLNNFSRPVDPGDKKPVARINTKELEILKNALSEGEGVNIAIIGETGTGRQQLVSNLALDLIHRNVPTKIMGKRLVEFFLDNLLAITSSEEEKILLLEKTLFEAVAAGNIILFIPTLETYLETDTDKDRIGQVNISSILTNFLENTDLQIVTIANQQEINTLFHDHPNLTKYFKLVQLEESDPEDSLLILCEKGRLLENQFGKLITYSALKKTYEISNRYLQETAMPERALDFLEEVLTYLAEHKPDDHLIKEAEIEAFGSMRIGSAIGSLQSEEKEKLANLEEEMKKLIVGQTEAVAAVVSSLRRRRLDLSNPERPAGCFLFLGPTGVGKTHTAEVLANLYYGGENRMSRLDMSEYQGEDGITKLLGDPTGKIEGYLRKILASNSFGLVLLDELEKASTEVHQLLLQIMEEGIAKTGTGKKLNFRETIIIATSNAEALLIQELVKKKESYASMYQKVIDEIQQDRIFSPELLNRFDDIIVFHPLSQEELAQVAELALKALARRLAGKDILITWNENFKNQLAKIGYDPVFGARELRRVVEKQIEAAIAKDLLAGKIKKEEEFELPVKYLNQES